MALDLTDSAIGRAYSEIRSGSGALNWFTLAYQGRGATLVLRHAGADGLDGLRGSLTPNEVLFGLLKLDERLLLWSQIPHTVGGTKRARALVHSRALGSSFRAHTAAFNAASPDEFELSTIEAKLLHGSPSLRSPHGGFSPPPSSSHSPPPSDSQSPRSPYHQQPSQFASPSPLSSQFSSRRPSATQQTFSPQPTPISDRFETVRRPSLPQSSLPSGMISAASDLSIRDRDISPRSAVPPPHHQQQQQHPTSSSSQQPREYTSSPPSLPAVEPLSVPHRRPSVINAGYPAGLGAPLSSSTISNPDSPAPRTNWPQRKASLSHSQGRPRPSAVSPPSSSAHQFSASLPPSHSYSHAQSTATHERGPSDASFDSAEDGGLFASAAAAMLAPNTPDPNHLHDAQSNSNPDLEAQSPPLVVDTPIYNRHFAGVSSSGVSLKPSVQSFPASVVPDEDDDEEDDEHNEEARALAAAAAASERAQREDAVRLERERREREAEELAREEAERHQVALLEAAQAEERRVEEEKRRFEAEAEAARIAAEKQAAFEESERVRRAEEAEAERVRAEEERVRLEEEEERTRQAEEEMKLLIERQKAERLLREEEERRRAEEEKQREQEERRRGLVESREKGEVMLTGWVSVQGGDSMLWKRRHFQVSTAGLMLYKSDLEIDHPLDTVPLTSVAVRNFGVEDAPVPNSFKIVLLRDDDEYRFYTGEPWEKDRLVEAVKCAARLG